MKTRHSGFGFYIILILLVFFFWYYFSAAGTSTITMSQLKSALESKSVRSIVIRQNTEVPTGEARISLSSSEKVSVMYVSDVNELQQVLDASGFTDYSLTDVPRDGWLRDMLPILIVVAAMFLLFMTVLNSQNAMQGGAGGGGRMMNFGKSRARMTT